jgi:phosphoribosyl-ATP pyrophosphohydrolase
MVLLGARGIPFREVLQELSRRHASREASRGAS